MAWTPKAPLRAIWCGRVRFDSALKAQELLRARVVEDKTQACMLLCEHPPSLTMGRRAQPEHVLWERRQLDAVGLSLFETPRGGEATLHAPGQLVAYPVCYVGKKIRAHINELAAAAVGVMDAAGVRGAEMNWDHPGVWRDGAKFASIGVHVSRGVAIQGLSLNVHVDPALFGALVSCGMPTVRMQSLWPLRSQDACEASFVGEQGPNLPAIARHFARGFATAGDYALTFEKDPSACEKLGLVEA